MNTSTATATGRRSIWIARPAERPRSGAAALVLCVVLGLAPGAGLAEQASELANPSEAPALDVEGAVAAPATDSAEPTHHESPKPEPDAETAHGAPRWSPPDARPEKDEWVKLKSGEWLRGKITVMRNEELQFDSEELDDLKLKWEDIAEIRSPRINTFAFTDRRTALGIGQIIGKEVIVLTALGAQSYSRDDLLSIVTGGESEWHHWTFELSAGFTLNSGNTNQFSGLLTTDIERRTAFNRFIVDYTGNYGTQSGATTASNQGVIARVDLFIYKRFFVTPLVTDFYTDQFQNIRYRLSPGAGVGYELLKQRWIELTVGLDGTYRATKYFSVQPGFDLIDRDAALRFSTSWEVDITTIVELDGGYSVTMGIPDPSNTNQHFDSTLSVDITKVLEVNLTFIWDRVGQPQPDSQGVIPLNDDVTLSLGLGIEF